MKLFHNSFSSSNDGLPEGRIVPPKWMNFLKKFHRGGGGHFQSKNLCCRYWTLKQHRLELFRKFIRFDWTNQTRLAALANKWPLGALIRPHSVLKLPKLTKMGFMYCSNITQKPIETLQCSNLLVSPIEVGVIFLPHLLDRRTILDQAFPSFLHSVSSS